MKTDDILELIETLNAKVDEMDKAIAKIIAEGNQVIERNLELIAERDRYKADADRLALVVKALDHYYTSPIQDPDDWQARWIRFANEVLEPARAALAAHERGEG